MRSGAPAALLAAKIKWASIKLQMAGALPITENQTDLEMALAANEAIGDVLKIIGFAPIVFENVFNA